MFTYQLVVRIFEITNNQQGFSKLLTWLAKNYQHLSDFIIVFESTGSYERNLREFLKANNIYFATVHPNKVRNYAKARGWIAKTDKIDSKLLYYYATTFALPIKDSYNTESQEKLHKLLKRREQLILFKNQEIAKLDTDYNSVIIHSLENIYIA